MDEELDFTTGMAVLDKDNNMVAFVGNDGSFMLGEEGRGYIDATPELAKHIYDLLTKVMVQKEG